jgi:hypothetical protein
MFRPMRLRVPLLAAAAAAAAAAVPGPATAATPPIRHVFVIVLENKDAAKTFAADSPAPFLAHTLPRQGVFIRDYYGIGHLSLPNYIAMISGQAPNPQTQSDCQLYSDFVGGAMTPDGQAVGSGCVYPAAVPTLPDQLSTAGLTWKGYMEDMGKDPARDGGTTCAHPPLNAHDPTQQASATDQYAVRHNPFVYFHSIVDAPICATAVVPLEHLRADLATSDTTPSYSFITPDLCHDAHDDHCADGTAGGLPAADAFLREWVPRIVGSPAFRDGLLVVTFDEAESDSSACCNEPTGPNTPAPGGPSGGPGGGRVGAVLVSPYIKAGTTTTKAYNHYSLLRSVEDLFALPPIGYAAMQGLARFGDDVYSNPTGAGPDPSFPAATGPGGDAGSPASSGTSATTGGAGCRPRTLTGLPARLKAGTLLTGLAVSGTGGKRVLRFAATHAARVAVRDGARTRTLRVRACRAYRLWVRAGARVRVTAWSGRHAERRSVG